MSNHHTRFSLVAAVALLCGTGCDSPISPAEAQVPRSMEEQDLLLQVLSKLDSLEARLDRVTAGGMVLAARADNPGNTGIPEQMTELRELSDSIMARTVSLGALSDSIMVLASFVAADVADPRVLELCGQLGIKGQAELSAVTQGDAEGEGGVGVKPWDTGAQAKATLTQRAKVDLKGAGELGVTFGGCLDLTAVGSDPPVRAPATNAVMASAASAGLEASLLDLQTRLGLNALSLERAVVGGTDIFQSGDLTRLAELPGILPVPTGMASPLALVRGRLSSFDSFGLLCEGTTFEGRIQGVVTEGCDFIRRNDLPDLGTFRDLGDNFASLQQNFDGLCGNFNSVIGRRLVIDTDLPWEGGSLNVRLFPASWAVGCGD